MEAGTEALTRRAMFFFYACKVGDELVAIEGRDAKSLSIDEIHQLSLGDDERE
jgi:hypothetical protein